MNPDVDSFRNEIISDNEFKYNLYVMGVAKILSTRNAVLSPQQEDCFNKLKSDLASGSLEDIAVTVILAGAGPAGALFDALCTSYGILEATEKYNKCLYGN